MVIGDASAALAVSVRMRMPPWLSWYCRAGVHASYDVLFATPGSPSAVRRHVIDFPICATPAIRIGSMFGSIGSMYGGMKMRLPLDPCWWMSLTICGYHTEYSE